MTKSVLYDPDYARARVFGRVGTRAGSSGITVSDDQGNEVENAIEIRAIGARVADGGDYVASLLVELGLLDFTAMTPAQLTANTDDWDPIDAVDAQLVLSVATVIRASSDASRNLTGIVAPTGDRALILANVGAFDLVLKHDATSTPANRIYCPNDTDLTLQKDSAVVLVYDETSERWRVIDRDLGTLSPTSFTFPSATSPAQTAEGSAVWDSDDDVLTVGDGASRKTFGKLGTTVGTALGTAAAGSSVEASRVDHVHTLPKLDDLAAPDDNTDLDASTAKHGLLKKLNGSTTQFLRADGSFAVPSGVGGGDSFWDQIITKASTHTVTNSNTFVSDSELTFSYLAGEAYMIQLILQYTTDATGDIKYRLHASAGTISGALRVFGTDTTGNAVVDTAQRDSAADTTAIALGGGSLSIIRLVLIDGLFYGGSNATVSLQMAQNVTTSGQTATTLAGSRLAYRKLA